MSKIVQLSSCILEIQPVQAPQNSESRLEMICSAKFQIPRALSKNRSRTNEHQRRRQSQTYGSKFADQQDSRDDRQTCQHNEQTTLRNHASRRLEAELTNGSHFWLDTITACETQS